MPTASLVLDGPAGLGLTLSPLRRGGPDPTFRTADGAIWRTSLMRTGGVTARLSSSALDTVDCEVWGDGAAEFLDRLPGLVGVRDDTTGFDPAEPTIAEAWHRVPHLRLCQTGRVLEALIPAILEQRVHGVDA